MRSPFEKINKSNFSGQFLGSLDNFIKMGRGVLGQSYVIQDGVKNLATMACVLLSVSALLTLSFW